MALSQVRDLCNAAAACHARGDAGQGLKLASEAVALCRTVLGEEHYAYPLALAALGTLQLAAGDAGGAAETMARAEALARVVATTDFEHGHAALAHACEFAKSQGQRQRAAALMEEIVALHAEHLGEDHPRYFEARRRLAETRALSG